MRLAERLERDVDVFDFFMSYWILHPQDGGPVVLPKLASGRGEHLVVLGSMLLTQLSTV